MNEFSIEDGKKFNIKLFNINWRHIVEKFRQIDLETSKIKFQFFSKFSSRKIESAATISGEISTRRPNEDFKWSQSFLDSLILVFQAKSGRSYFFEHLTEEIEIKKVFIFTFFSHLFFLSGSLAMRPLRLPKLAAEAAKKGKINLRDPGGRERRMFHSMDSWVAGCLRYQ